MDTVEFTIPGRVKGKGRPKFARRGNFVHAYTPSDTVNAESMVRRFGSEAMAGRPAFLCALVLDITITLNTPPSWSKRKRAENPHPTGRPDLDNVVKLLGDALNGIIWKDDSQLCEVRARRVFNDRAPESVRLVVSPPAVATVEAQRPAAPAPNAMPLFGREAA